MQITYAELQGYPVVRVEGDLTMATAAQLHDALSKVAVEQPDGLLCDLRGLRAATSSLTIFHVVLDGISSWLFSPLVLLTGDPAVRARLVTLGIARRAPLAADVEEALRALRGVPSYLRASMVLSAGDVAVLFGETFLVTTLTTWRVPRCVEPVRSIARELITNAVQHAGGPIQLRVSTGLQDTVVTVADRGLGGTEPGLSDTGLGLRLVDSLARRWGVLHRVGGGHLVWASLRCRRDAIEGGPAD